MDENKKVCKYCNEIKEKNDFRKSRLKCKKCEKEYNRNYRKSDNGKEKTKKWNEANKEKFIELKATYHKLNRDKINSKYMERYNNDPIFKLHSLTKRRISLCLHKNQTTDKYIGCSSDELKEWLEFSFSDVMTYKNHGEIWHIDHVIPINEFNLSNGDEQLTCFNWRNLMPFPSKKNLSKNKKIDHNQIIIHYKNLQNFHKQKNKKIPEEFIQLYAKHLNSGESLKH